MLPASRLPVNPLLAEGAHVAGRYRIVRFIAAGGMGEVYEAQDDVAGGRVALKVVRHEPGPGAAAGRPRREVQLARRVTHGNVCRIFDLGMLRLDGSGQELPFLTMELLEGETLAARLRRQGRMPLDDARPLLEQLAAALDAAHAAGVVHRDFKTGNVILVDRAGAPPRAVVTDFGLARATDADATVTRTGELLGTPAFMAPEQVEGGEVGAAADVYAFGVAMYQLATGSLPWVGETTISVAVARLKGGPTPPRELVPDLDPRWEGVILRCMARDPRDRFASAGDAMRALAGERVPPPRGALARRRMALVGAALLLGAGTSGALALHWLGRREHSAPAPVAARPTAVVLDFRNLSGRPADAWVGTAIAEMLRTELGAGGTLRVLPGAEVTQLHADLALGDDLAPSALPRIAERVPSAWVVHGTFVVLGDRVRVDARIDDAAHASQLATASETGAVDGIDAVVTRLAARLRAPVGLPAPTAEQSRNVRATLPSTADAARPYAQGLAELRLHEYAAAREHLARAVAADPAWATGHAALADAEQALGDISSARAEAHRAVELSGALPEAERLSLEARDAELSGRDEEAIDRWQRLRALEPDDLDVALRLATALSSGNRSPEAFALLEELRRAPLAGDDPRIDLVAARVADDATDYAREEAAASRALDAAEKKGHRLVAAEARQRRAWAQFQLGKLDAAAREGEGAAAALEAAGDPGAAGQAWNAVAAARWQQGRLPEALSANARALALIRAAGNRADEGSIIANAGLAYARKGDLAEARRRFDEAGALQLDNGWEQYGAAWVDLQSGALARAGTRLDAALARSRDLGDRALIARVLDAQGELALLRGDLSSARRRYEEALALRRKLGAAGFAAESRVGLARVALAEGRLDEAEREVRAALEEQSREGALDESAEARAVLSATLRARGRLEDAARELAPAVALANESQNRLAQAHASLEAATLRAARRPEERAAALAELSALLPGLDEAGLAIAALEVRLARARIAGDGVALAAVVKEARALGASRLAREATGASSAPAR